MHCIPFPTFLSLYYANCIFGCLSCLLLVTMFCLCFIASLLPCLSWSWPASMAFEILIFQFYCFSSVFASVFPLWIMSEPRVSEILRVLQGQGSLWGQSSFSSPYRGGTTTLFSFWWSTTLTDVDQSANQRPLPICVMHICLCGSWLCTPYTMQFRKSSAYHCWQRIYIIL